MPDCSSYLSIVVIISRATTLVHVEQTQPRHAAPLQQVFVDVLLVQLFNLRRRHVPPVRSNVPIRFRPHIHQIVVRSRRHQHREQFFLQHGQPPLQIFQTRKFPRALDGLRHLTQRTRFFPCQRSSRESRALWQLRFLKLLSTLAQERCNLRRFKSRLSLSLFCAASPDRSFLHILSRRQHRLRAIRQAVYFFRFRGTLIVLVKRVIHPAEHSFQGDASALPSLNQSPIKRRKQ